MILFDYILVISHMLTIPLAIIEPLAFLNKIVAIAVAAASTVIFLVSMMLFIDHYFGIQTVNVVTVTFISSCSILVYICRYVKLDKEREIIETTKELGRTTLIVMTIFLLIYIAVIVIGIIYMRRMNGV